MRKTFLFILALCATTLAWGEMTTGPVTYAIIAKQNGWAENSYNQTLDVDGVISVTAKWDGNTKNGKSISNTSWRIYQKNLKGEFAINAAPGFIIKTIKLTYATNNNGVCSKTANESPSTTATGAADQIQSGTVYDVNASSITLYVGVTKATTTSGDITISLQSFEITYDMTEPYVTENFKTPDGTDWSFNYADDPETHGVDGKYYKWTIDHCRYASNTNDQTKSHGKGVGMWKTKNSSLITTAEGGVKAIMFYWNQFAADESSKTDKLAVWLNGTAQSNQPITGTTKDKRGGDVLCYLTPTTGLAPASWPKDNCELKLTPGGHTEARVTFGPITIVPYLRYTYTETKQVNDDESTFDCSLQIDNTDGEGTIAYSSDNTDAVSFADPANPEATIVGGGEATITATWSEASTSFKLKVNVLPTPAVTFSGITGGKKSVALNVESFTEAATVDMTVPIVYSSSNENVATVNEEGKVTVLTTGTTEITAKVEAKKGEYKEASATYTLTVTASEASEVSFVEKYGNTATWDSYSNDKKITGTDNIFYWVANNTRRKSDDKIGSNVGLRFGNSLDEGSYQLQSDPEHNGGIMEGGIKRIAFKYKEAKDGTGVNLKISAGTEERILKTDPKSGVELPFAANFFVKENTSLKMFNTKGASVVTIGPITITPYLLYTKKTDSKMLVEDGENIYINTELINNTGQELSAIAFTTDNLDIAVMKENPAYPGTLKLVGGIGDVTVTAKWVPDATKQDEFVTTSYVLHVTNKEYSDAKFTTEGKVEHVLADGTFTNAVTFTKGEGSVSYSSDNEAVATVNTTGLVTIHGIGTAIISGHMDETDNYHAWDGSYTLVVCTGIDENNKLVEKFTQMPKNIISTTDGEDVTGDIGIDWHAYNVRRGANDTIGGTGVQGINIHTKGYVNTTSELEGGIKYFSFNWKQWANESNCTLKLRAKLGESDFSMEKAGTGVPTYEHYFFAINAGIKSNVGIALYNESYNEDGPLASNGRITFDAFEIVPYLYYTEKQPVMDNAYKGEIYTHPIINNIDNEEGTITYSLISEGADDIASINASTGEVIVKAGGVVTIQAMWVPDDAEEDEFVTTTYELTINFPTPEVTFTAPESVALDGTIGEGDMNVVVKVGGEPVDNPTITYTSSNNNVIKITDAGWNVIGIGTTTITANVDGTTTYGPASATAEIEVTNIIPATGTAWKETFSSLGTNNGYDITLTTIEGDNNVLKWKTRNFERNASTDKIKINGEQGIRLNNNGKTVGDKKYDNPGYVEYFTEGDVTSQEGGIKRVQFQWRIPGDQDNKKVVFDVKYKEGDQTVVRTLTYNGIAHATVYDYAQNFNLKNNNKLTIAGSKTSESPVIIGPITITPYLLYTEKIVSVTYDLEGTNEVDVTENLINNLEESEIVTYSLSEGAQAQIDGSTITLENVTEDITVTATWGEVSTTYTLKVKAKTPDFTLENKTAGALATVCLPNKIDRIENATLYSISYGNTQMIEFVEAALEKDAAGMPYLVQVAETGNVNFFYIEGEPVEKPVSAEDAKGFVGSLSDSNIDIPSDRTAILVSGGQLHIAGTNCVLTKNHAYIDATKLPTEPEPVGAPRKTIRLYNPDAAPTNFNGLNGAVKPMKVLRDGQFYIIRDTKTYNAQGILVE